MSQKKTQIISFDDFLKLDLRIGQVISAKPLPQSQKLLALEVDFGLLGQRQVLAGLKDYYEAADLIGKQFVFAVNLPPKKMMGRESQAMILAADDGNKVVVIAPVSKVDNGAKVR